MSEVNQENLTARVAELEQKLDASLNAISSLVKAFDHMRGGDDRFIFELDLVKHCLNEAGCTQSNTPELPDSFER